MLEYVMLGVGSLVVGWLVQQHLRLRQQVVALQQAVAQCPPTRSAPLKESAGQIIDELKAVADGACNEVIRALEQLRAAQREVEDVMAKSGPAPSKKQGVPVAAIIQHADEGLTPSEIARQAGVGLAEVDLVLRTQRVKRESGTIVRPVRRARQHQGGEEAVA